MDADLSDLSEVDSLDYSQLQAKKKTQVPELIDIKLIFEEPTTAESSKVHYSHPQLSGARPPQSLGKSHGRAVTEQLIEAYPIKKFISEATKTFGLLELLQDLTTNCNLSLENKEIHFYLESSELFMNCGIQPIHSDIRIHVEDFMRDVNPTNNGESTKQDAGQKPNGEAGNPEGPVQRNNQSTSNSPSITIKVRTLSHVHLLHRLMARDNQNNNLVSESANDGLPLQPMEEEESSDENDAEDEQEAASSSYTHNALEKRTRRRKKCRRTKERRIGVIIKKVIEWRNYYAGFKNDNNQHVKLSLEDAAKEVKVSKKSLDDYLFQIRFGHNFGFNFNEHYNSKVGVLRRFVKHKKQLQDGHKTKASRKEVKREEKQAERRF